MHTEFIRRLTELVETNMGNENFGTEDLAREIGMSHSNLHRKLKSISNQTISQFIREVRLKKAKELLQNEELTVAEISYKIGFGSPTYFNKCFHDYFGFAPGEFRNRESEGEPDETKFVVQPEKRKRPKLLIVLIICSLVLIPLSFFLINQFLRSKAADAKEKTIAILPFKYMSDEPEKQYLADGMMEAIILHLSKIKDLRVVSRTSVEQYRNTTKTVKEIGRELNVAYLLEGSFQKEGDQIRLILQLIKTKEEGHGWSNEYDRDWKDIFSVQSEVAETIASELDLAITPQEKQMIKKVVTTNLTAYDFYQRGKDELSKWVENNYNRSALDKSKKYFFKALEYDPKFPLAYSRLAFIYFIKWSIYYSENYLDSTLILVDKAIAIDNQLAEAHTVKGYYYRVTNKPELAIKESDLAIQLNPNEWEAYFSKGITYQWELENFVEALINYNDAIKRNRGKELPEILKRIGRTYLDAGFTKKARENYLKALELDDDSASYFSNMLLTFTCEENFEEALRYAFKAYQADSSYIFDLPLYYTFQGNDKESFKYAKKYTEDLKKTGEVPLNILARIGYSYWKVGETKEAGYYFDQLIQMTVEKWKELGRVTRGGGDFYDPAIVFAFLGDKANAYNCLNEFSKRRVYAFWWIAFLKHDPLFDGIREEPRFQKIYKEVEGKYQAEHERVRKWLVSEGML